MVCIGHLYNRLNQDYHPMHALCRFFLEHSGPTHELGDRSMLPFLVNMERLFELFVSDVEQVVAYAIAKGCREAVLVYPAPLGKPLDTMVNQIRVRILTFSLDGNLEQAGQNFLRELEA